ncbi:Proton/sodium-glutamate symport protein [Planctomycetes bacterium Pan216]|uniref:Proton/sodium-glutamate symport protein n=1 Tax=Kolteria novifilia TaxID=2527975 RepID=A0A518B1P2_9BACT|nr:Proton/sodium-glutamate symport protein [Planctomycetes bacterium Pan216]
MTSAMPNESAQQEKSGGEGLGGLIAIIVGIVLGVLLGGFYGRQMWMALNGPHERVERLEATAAQKALFAERADKAAAEARAKGDNAAADRDEAKAKRYRDAIPKINNERERIVKLANDADAQMKAGQLGLAYSLGVFTSFVGDIFLRMLKGIVIPLVFTSMICGITSLGDIRRVGKIGIGTVAYYMLTTAVAVFIGILLVQMIQPGVGADDTFAYVSKNIEAKERSSAVDTLLAVFRGRPGEPGSGMFPENIFLAATETNVLALIVFALVFGGAVTTLGVRAQPVVDFFNVVNDAVMKIVHLIMYFAPVGIFGLVAANIAKEGGGREFLGQLSLLGFYVMTVIIALGIHSGFLFSLIVFVARRRPIQYTLGVLRALLTAVSTSSSSATLPITLECVEENNKVSNQAASFVLPLGATINMDGTALYEAVAVIFIAQSQGISLGGAELFIIFLTATLAAVGAAGIPQAGLVTMVIVLTAVDLPMAGIGTILAVDWFLDRLRTTVNVYGDATGAAVIDRLFVAGASTKS